MRFPRVDRSGAGRIRTAIVCASSLLLAIAATVSSTAPASASPGSRINDTHQLELGTGASVTPTALPLTGLTQMVVDDAHHHVFLTGFSPVIAYVGTNDSKVVVVNFDGSIEKSFTGLPGAAGLYLEAANNRLWVAEAAGDALQVINTDTLTLGPSYPLGANADCPLGVAQAAGLIWVSVGCGTNGGGMASLDPGSSTVTGFGSAGAGALLKVDPADTDLVFTAGIGGNSITEYNVSTGTPSVVASSTGGTDGWANTQDIDPMPDGSDVIGASGYPYYLDALKVADLSGDVQYVTGPYPVAVTVSSDSKFVLGGTTSVSVFKTGTATVYRSIDTALTGWGIGRRGLALNASASKLFVVTGDLSGPQYLRVVPDPTKLPSKLTIASSRKKVQYPDRVRLTAHLSPFHPGEIVTLFATPYGKGKKAFAQGPVNSSGNFSASFRPDRLTDFSAASKGDATYLPTKSGPVSVAVQVNVSGRLRHYYGVSRSYRLYHQGKLVFFTCSVKPNLGGQYVLVWFQFPTATEGWMTAAHHRFKLRKDSTVTVYIGGLPRGSYRINCEYRGDASHLRDWGRFSYFKVT